MVDNASQEAHPSSPPSSSLSSSSSSSSSDASPPLPLGTTINLPDQLLPAPGFDQIAILWRGGVSSAPTTTTASTPSSSGSGGRRELPPRQRARAKRTRSSEEESARDLDRGGAFTLLCVDSDVIRKLVTTVCQRWGQPYQTAENGQQAVNMYKRDPERFRCILMDTDMPVLSGLGAIKQIRAFEQESWASSNPGDGNRSSTTTSASASASVSVSTPVTDLGVPSSSSDAASIPPPPRRTKPVRRAVAIALAPPNMPSMVTRCANAGFDMILRKPLRINMVVDLLFSGAATNVVSLYGGVDQQALQDAGYPLKMRPWGPRRDPDIEEVVVSGTR